MKTKWIRLTTVLVATVLLTLALVFAAANLGTQLEEVVRSVLRGASFLAGEISDASDAVLPSGSLFMLTFAFTAGMIAAVNPCGFAILPAYLTLYLSDGRMAQGGKGASFKIVARGLFVSLTIGLGFIVLFGSIGSIVGFAAEARGLFTSALPWIGLTIGIIMLGLGFFLLLGGKLYSSLPQKYAGKIGSPQQVNLKGYFLFGISYALASLSCTLPLFIAIMLNALNSNGIYGIILTFVTYGLGMTFIITILTLGISIFKAAFARGFFKILPYVNILSAILITVLGLYLIIYWLVEGRLIEDIPFV